ncbi:peroxiredoxin [Erysipelotrichaceae bacterium MTC7]|nr:peroxiredoxin [Erysipelotrichaceae bacterium MTC7]
MLAENTKAYDFALEDADGKVHHLHDYLGKKVVVYFYPKDHTAGCTKQACAFRNAFQDFHDENTVVIGISKDSKDSHRKFIDKYDLPFILLSDPTLDAIEQYGVWVEKNMYGKKYMGVARATFVIDEQGTIIKVYKRANPQKNAEEIVEYLKSL